MAIAIPIPFPRPADRATGDRPRRAAAPIAARPDSRVYSPYGRRRLAGPMAVPAAGTVTAAATLGTTGGRPGLRFFRARRR